MLPLAAGRRLLGDTVALRDVPRPDVVVVVVVDVDVDLAVAMTPVAAAPRSAPGDTDGERVSRIGGSVDRIERGVVLDGVVPATVDRGRVVGQNADDLGGRRLDDDDLVAASFDRLFFSLVVFRLPDSRAFLRMVWTVSITAA